MTMSAELKAISFEMYWRRDGEGRYAFRVQEIVKALDLKGVSWLMRAHLRRTIDERCTSCSEQIVVAGRVDLRTAEMQCLCPRCALKRARSSDPARKLADDAASLGAIE